MEFIAPQNIIKNNNSSNNGHNHGNHNNNSSSGNSTQIVDSPFPNLPTNPSNSLKHSNTYNHHHNPHIPHHMQGNSVSSNLIHNIQRNYYQESPLIRPTPEYSPLNISYSHSPIFPPPPLPISSPSLISNYQLGNQQQHLHPNHHLNNPHHHVGHHHHSYNSGSQQPSPSHSTGTPTSTGLATPLSISGSTSSSSSSTPQTPISSTSGSTLSTPNISSANATPLQRDSNGYPKGVYESSPAVGSGCGDTLCSLCTQGAPSCLSSRSSWSIILWVVFYSLKMLSKEKEFFSLKKDVYNFVLGHWDILCPKKSRSFKWKKQIQDALSHSKVFKSGIQKLGCNGFWKLKFLTNPWTTNKPVELEEDIMAGGCLDDDDSYNKRPHHDILVDGNDEEDLKKPNKKVRVESPSNNNMDMEITQTNGPIVPSTPHGFNGKSNSTSPYSSILNNTNNNSNSISQYIPMGHDNFLDEANNKFKILWDNVETLKDRFEKIYQHKQQVDSIFKTYQDLTDSASIELFNFASNMKSFQLDFKSKYINHVNNNNNSNNVNNKTNSQNNNTSKNISINNATNNNISAMVVSPSSSSSSTSSSPTTLPTFNFGEWKDSLQSLISSEKPDLNNFNFTSCISSQHFGPSSTTTSSTSISSFDNPSIKKSLQSPTPNPSPNELEKMRDLINKTFNEAERKSTAVSPTNMQTFDQDVNISSSGDSINCNNIPTKNNITDIATLKAINQSAMIHSEDSKSHQLKHILNCI